MSLPSSPFNWLRRCCRSITLSSPLPAPFTAAPVSDQVLDVGRQRQPLDDCTVSIPGRPAPRPGHRPGPPRTGRRRRRRPSGPAPMPPSRASLPAPPCRLSLSVPPDRALLPALPTIVFASVVAVPARSAVPVKVRFSTLIASAPAHRRLHLSQPLARVLPPPVAARIVHDVHVVALAPGHLVRPGAAIERVVAGTAVECVVAGAAVERVVAVQPIQLVGRAVAGQHVVQPVAVPLTAPAPVSVRFSTLAASVRPDRGLHRIHPSPGVSPPPVARLVHHIDVVAEPPPCGRRRCRRPACRCRPRLRGCRCRFRQKEFQWIFRRADLEQPAAQTIVHRARQGARHPTGPNPEQQSLFPSTT